MSFYIRADAACITSSHVTTGTTNDSVVVFVDRKVLSDGAQKYISFKWTPPIKIFAGITS